MSVGEDRAFGIAPSNPFVLAFAYHLGVLERRRIGQLEIKDSLLVPSEEVLVAAGGGSGTSTPPTSRRFGRRSGSSAAGRPGRRRTTTT